MKIQLSDFQMAYTDVGQGRPILFIHGFPLNRLMWELQIKNLSNSFHILAPDLRGHGESTATTGPYSMDLLADDLANFLDRIQIKEKVVVCGLSMGGYISLAFTRRYPERLSGLILASTRAAPDSIEARENRDRASELVQKVGLKAIVTGMSGRLFAHQTIQKRPELIQHVEDIMYQTSIQGVLGDLMGMKDRPDSVPFLAKIHVPTLVIHGADDQIVPVAEAQAMAALIPQSKIVVLPEAGHLPNLEQFEAFNRAILDFLVTSNLR